MKELNFFWNFLIKPNTEERKASKFAARFFIVLAIDIAAVLFALGLQHFLKHFGLIDIELYPTIAKSNTVEVITTFFTISFIVPIFEELIFRLHLLPRNRNIKISIVTGILYLAAELIVRSQFNIRHTLFITLIIIIILIGYFIFSKRINDAIIRAWNKKFPFVFYTIALLFGFVHIVNYELSFKDAIFIPVIVAPQIILGINIGYLRVTSGFQWGLILHTIHNILFFGIYVLLATPNMLSLDEKFIIDYPPNVRFSKDYVLEINEVTENSLSNYKILPNEIYFENSKVKEIFIILSNANNAEVIFDNQDIANTNLHVRFTNSENEQSSLRNKRYYIIQELFNKYKLTAQLYLIPENQWVLIERGKKNAKGTNTTTPECSVNNVNFSTMHNVTAMQVAEYISSSYSISCIPITGNLKIYNFAIPQNNIVALQKTLLENGLELCKTKKPTHYFYIRSMLQKTQANN